MAEKNISEFGDPFTNILLSFYQFIILTLQSGLSQVFSSHHCLETILPLHDCVILYGCVSVIHIVKTFPPALKESVKPAVSIWLLAPTECGRSHHGDLIDHAIIHCIIPESSNSTIMKLLLI